MTGFSLLENVGVENDMKQMYSLYLGFLLQNVEVENDVKTVVCMYIYIYICIWIFYYNNKMAAENGWLELMPRQLRRLYPGDGCERMTRKRISVILGSGFSQHWPSCGDRL